MKIRHIHVSNPMGELQLAEDTHLVCEDRNFLIKMSITELAEIAGEQDKKLLIPVHRSYLVNPDYISSIERYTLTLLNGTKIPIPVRKYNEVREVLLHFYEGAEA